MLKKKLIFLLAILVLPLISSSIVDGNCPSGSTCMFSIYSLSDAHVAECGFFNYSVCYPGILNVTLEYSESATTCTSGNFVFSQFSNNDSHVAINQDFFNYSLCVEGTTCEIGTTCYREHKIISINKEENSHVGEYLYYELGLCCGQVVRGISGASPGVTPVSEVEPEVVAKEIIEEVTEITNIIKKIPWYFYLFLIFLFLTGRKTRKKIKKERTERLKDKEQEKQKKKREIEKQFYQNR